MRYLPSTWIPCADCAGQRFSDEVLGARVAFDDQRLSIADFYELSIAQARACGAASGHSSSARPISSSLKRSASSRQFS